jgi:hypothetical protein
MAEVEMLELIAHQFEVAEGVVEGVVEEVVAKEVHLQLGLKC